MRECCTIWLFGYVFSLTVLCTLCHSYPKIGMQPNKIISHAIHWLSTGLKPLLIQPIQISIISNVPMYITIRYETGEVLLLRWSSVCGLRSHSKFHFIFLSNIFIQFRNDSNKQMWSFHIPKSKIQNLLAIDNRQCGRV